jgi:hypothetical protein
MQVILVPSVGRRPATVKIAGPDGLADAPSAVVVSKRITGGWTLAAMVPFALLGVDAGAITLALDLAVNAHPTATGARARAYLAGDQNPQPNSTNYARIRITPQSVDRAT